MADWLDNRHAIVTGAARGIGLAVSQTLALLGARVLMVDNGCAVDGAPEDPAVSELAAARVPGSEFLTLDVAAEGSGQRMVDAALKAFGSVDLVIHAAGIQSRHRAGRIDDQADDAAAAAAAVAALADASRLTPRAPGAAAAAGPSAGPGEPNGGRTGGVVGGGNGGGRAGVDAAVNAGLSAEPDGADDEAPGLRASLERLLATDVLAAAELYEAVLPVFRRQRAQGRLPGAIVSLVSAEAVYGDPDLYVESVSKSALMGLTRSLSHRLAPLGVGCNAVIPMAGTRQTLDNGRVFGEEREAFHLSMKPLGPTAVANLIAWLCTPLAAGINGQVFLARGREILLFSQARPAGSFFQSQLLEPDEIAQSMKELRRDLTDDWTAPDAFGNDPVP